MSRLCRVRLSPLVVATWLTAGLWAQGPARDRAAAPPPVGTASISGSVIAADTGRPLKRARVVVSSTEINSRAQTALGMNQVGGPVRDRLQQMAESGDVRPGLQAALRLIQSAQTDDEGRFEIKGLVAGQYLVSAAKAGFVTVSFGQRRPLRPGTPLQVQDGQQLRNVSFALPRGSVITGHVMDEDGEPLARAAVTVLRYQYQSGERRLVAAGSGQSDDRGQYRIYGLSPGDYYVSAVSGQMDRPLDRLMPFADRLAVAGDPEQETLGYAPTYYPGVMTAAEAARVSVGLGQESANIDFQLQLVPLSRLSGLVIDAGGRPLAGGTVLLAPEESGASARGSTMGGRTRADGTFTIDQIPPGRYTLYARNRAGRNESPDFAVQAVTVSGQRLSSMTLTLTPGATVSGSISFDSTASAAPRDLSRFRITVPAVDPIPIGGSQPSEVDAEGAFTVSGIPASRRVIRAPGAPSPWVLKAVIVDGRDVTDTPIDVRNNQKITQVQVIFTDRVTELAGTVKDEKDAPISGFTVVAFSTDPSTWRAQSRTIQAVQSDQQGMFRLRGLPPGRYFLVAVDAVEQGEWFDAGFLEEAQKGAVRVTLSEGGLTMQDLSASTGGDDR